MFLLEIENNVRISDVRILLHDTRKNCYVGYSRGSRVTIEHDILIDADAITLLGVKIGSNVVIGVGTVVTSNIPEAVLL